MLVVTLLALSWPLALPFLDIVEFRFNRSLINERIRATGLATWLCSRLRRFSFIPSGSLQTWLTSYRRGASLALLRAGLMILMSRLSPLCYRLGVVVALDLSADCL